MLFGLILWAELFGFYLLFAGHVGTTELLAGAPAGLAAAVVGFVLHRVANRRFRLRRAPWGRVLAASFGALPQDTVAVGRRLLRALLHRPDSTAGRLRRQAFVPGGNGADDAGRRGTITLAASLAPNRFVLREQSKHGALLVHELAPAKPRRDRVWPL